MPREPARISSRVRISFLGPRGFQRQKNEPEVEFHENLPESIDAIFYMRDDDDCWDMRPQPWMPGRQIPKCEAYARWAHGELLARWPERAQHIPLVALDMWEWQTPVSAG